MLIHFTNFKFKNIFTIVLLPSLSSLFFFFFLMATPVIYGRSRAIGWIGMAAAGPCHSHSHWDLNHICDLHCSLWQSWKLNPLMKLWSKIFWIKMRPRMEPTSLGTPCQVLNPLSHNRDANSKFLAMYPWNHWTACSPVTLKTKGSTFSLEKWRVTFHVCLLSFGIKT